MEHHCNHKHQAGEEEPQLRHPVQEGKLGRDLQLVTFSVPTVLTAALRALCGAAGIICQAWYLPAVQGDGILESSAMGRGIGRGEGRKGNLLH